MKTFVQFFIDSFYQVFGFKRESTSTLTIDHLSIDQDVVAHSTLDQDIEVNNELEFVERDIRQRILFCAQNCTTEEIHELLKSNESIQCQSLVCNRPLTKAEEKIIQSSNIQICTILASETSLYSSLEELLETRRRLRKIQKQQNKSRSTITYAF